MYVVSRDHFGRFWRALISPPASLAHFGICQQQHKTTITTALRNQTSASVASVDAPASFDSEEVPIKGDRAAKAIVAAELRRSLRYSIAVAELLDAAKLPGKTSTATDIIGIPRHHGDIAPLPADPCPPSGSYPSIMRADANLLCGNCEYIILSRSIYTVNVSS
eukprot:scaffold2839_cov86-Skeletonema_dohrnii-CCMP3373.AAC.3